MKPKYILLFFFCFFGFFITRSYIDSKQEDNLRYDFLITKIELTPTKVMIFYDKDKEVFFHNFKIFYHEDVKIGDKVVKEKNSRVLRIFRKTKMEFMRDT